MKIEIIQQLIINPQQLSPFQWWRTSLYAITKVTKTSEAPGEKMSVSRLWKNFFWNPYFEILSGASTGQVSYSKKDKA